MNDQETGQREKPGDREGNVSGSGCHSGSMFGTLSLTLSQKLTNNISLCQLCVCLCVCVEAEAVIDFLLSIKRSVGVKSTGIVSATQMTQKEVTRSCRNIRISRFGYFNGDLNIDQ